MATMSTLAFGVQDWLKPIRLALIRSKVAVPRRATMNFHGCEFAADGDQRAASSAAVRVFSSISLEGSNERGLHRSVRTSRIGPLVSAVRPGAAGVVSVIVTGGSWVRVVVVDSGVVATTGSTPWRRGYSMQ